MKILLILATASAMVSVSWCAPKPVDRLMVLPALKHEEVHDEYGQYALRYITAKNTVVSERGYLVPTEDGKYVMEMDGQYQYVGDDKKVYVTRYHSGIGGFHVYADHLPKPVAVPKMKRS